MLTKNFGELLYDKTLNKPSKKTEKPLEKIVAKETLAEIESKWLDGWDANKIAIRYGYSEEKVEQWIHSVLVNKYRSRYERLAQVFDDLFASANVAQKSYLNNPTMQNSVAYTSIVNSLRGALVDLNSVQDSEELAQDIVTYVLNPLINKVTTTIIEELGSYKEELLIKFSDEDATRITNDVGERCSTHFSTAVENVAERLEEILQAKDKNKKRILKGKSFKSDHKTSTHLKVV